MDSGTYLTPWSRFPFDKIIAPQLVSITRVVWKMKIHYLVRRSSTLASILSQINPDETLISTVASRRQTLE